MEKQEEALSPISLEYRGTWDTYSIQREIPILAVGVLIHRSRDEKICCRSGVFSPYHRASVHLHPQAYLFSEFFELLNTLVDFANEPQSVVDAIQKVIVNHCE